MDGFKKRLIASIQLQLSFSLALAILVVAAAAGVFSFFSAFNEAHDLQDDMLKQVAALFDRQHLPLPPKSDGKRMAHQDEESRVIVQYLVAGSNATGKEDDVAVPLPLPTTLPDGLQTLSVGGEPFRILVKTTAIGERIAVAQETEGRDDIARHGAVRTLMPFLILVPILLVLVGMLVRKMFRPIAALSMEIDQREEQALHPIAENHLPVEIRPFVVAINRLLDRVARSVDAQRRFVADAAHELRSPLTAMSLQAERLAEADMSDLARERLASLQRGIERGRNLLDQLLTLARVQAAPSAPKAPVSVQSMCRRVLEDLMPLAEARHIDIGFMGAQDAHVLVNELDLIAIVKNLVDNAIRYSPDGGQVDLSVNTAQGHAVFAVQDNGPGIPVAERERIFDPFYRVLGSGEMGSGLGLSIVKAIAERIGAGIQLDFSDAVAGTGLCVSIRVPLAGAHSLSADHRK